MSLEELLRGILASPLEQPKNSLGLLASVTPTPPTMEQQGGLLGALYQNPLMQRQVAAQRAANPRPDVTDVFGYGQDWQSYLTNLNNNLQAQLPQLTDSGEEMARKGAAMVGNYAPFGITAFHGTPHKFDKFDLSKVGTGEGAKAYGHGLYFAENPAVANQYAQKLGGSTMKVDIPDEHIAKMLDWNKPLRQQPESVQRVFYDPSKPSAWADMTGMEAYVTLGQRFGNASSDSREVAKFLRERGIPGVRYLDEGSRAAGKGTSNFVLFDDSIPKILK